MRLGLVLAALAAPLGGQPPALPAGDGVRAEVARAGLTGRITLEQRAAWTGDLRRAEAVRRRLDGVRAAELGAVLGTLRAAPLTPSRMPLAFATVRHNTAFWRTAALPAAGARTTGRDGAVWQYVPGQGVQFHPLATAGRANAMAAACLTSQDAAHRRLLARAIGRTLSGVRPPHGAERAFRAPIAAPNARSAPVVAVGRRDHGCRPAQLRRALDTLLGAASERGGFLAWEYRYSYAGGPPLWVSGMAQATAASALARGGAALGVPAYGAAAERALGAFAAPPPLGIADRGEYVMYSFNPGLRIINGFLQSVIGLHDVAEHTGSATARRLYRAGERLARRALAHYDTGAWSRYSLGGRESTLSYHQLVTGFLEGLCERTGRATYCGAGRRFVRYEREPPRIHLTQPGRLRPGRATAATFSLSKVADVVVSVRRGDALVARHVLDLPRGAGYRVAWTPPRRGRYVVRVAAVGPEGRRGVATVTRRTFTPPRDRVRGKRGRKGADA